MSVITTQTGPSLPAASHAAVGAVNPAQGAAADAPADWQAALQELDALLQLALPAAAAMPQNAAPAQQISRTAAADTEQKPEAERDTASAPAESSSPQQPQTDLHTALRRLARADDETHDDPASPQGGAPTQPAQLAPVNTALLRQMSAPVMARASDADIEARADAMVRADAPRQGRGSALTAQLSILGAGSQVGTDAGRAEGAATLRLDTLLPERSQAFSMPAPTATHTQVSHEWAPLKLGDNSAQWGRQLLDTLRERVEMQVNQQVKQAHIRLDPPELGRLELTVRLDGDHLSVQINANHAQLRDALLQSGERLRAALMPQHAGGVSVDVGQDSGGDRSGQGRDEQGILAGRRSSPELDADLNELAPVGWLNTLV